MRSDKKIALKNNIEFNIEECTYEGDCTGTCPKCERELEYLEMELKKKQYKGEKIELEGIFTLTETEPTEIEEDTLFLSFGSPDPESFFDYLIAKHFYDYEDIKIINLLLFFFFKLLNYSNILTFYSPIHYFLFLIINI